MSERRYDRLANVFMLVAIGSALLFDSKSPWHWVVGVLGIAAGVAAVALYFANQSHGPAIPDSKESGEKEHTSPQMQPMTLSENWAAGLGADLEQYALYAYVREMRESSKAVRFYTHRNLVQHAAKHRHLAYFDMYEDPGQQEVSLSPSDIAACAIEIIRNLSSSGDQDRWEFTFGTEGLRIVSAEVTRDRPSTPEPEVDTGQMSRMVN